MNTNKVEDIYGYRRVEDPLETINKNILKRNFPDVVLKPNLDLRPVNTRYTMNQNPKVPVEELDRPYLDYYLESNFAPCHAKAPLKMTNTQIQLENELRGQNVPLHGGDLALKYVPNPNSDLYRIEVPITSHEKQPHPLLFARMEHDKKTHANNFNKNVGNELFYNHTRTQLRNTVDVMKSSDIDNDK